MTKPKDQQARGNYAKNLSAQKIAFDWKHGTAG
jgi:hypothetical protein